MVSILGIPVLDKLRGYFGHLIGELTVSLLGVLDQV